MSCKGLCSRFPKADTLGIRQGEPHYKFCKICTVCGGKKVSRNYLRCPCCNVILRNNTSDSESKRVRQLKLPPKRRRINKQKVAKKESQDVFLTTIMLCCFLHVLKAVGFKT